MITQTFDLNLIPNSAPVIIHIDQYDVGDGRLIATLYNGNVAYTPSAGATAYIQGMKPDGHGFMYEATISGNTVTADVTKQMTACAGRVRTQFVISESDNRTGTFVFEMDVQKSALPADSDMSTSAYQIVEDLLDRAEEINANTPRIGANGNWWIWSSEAQDYVDTGVDASITINIGTVTTLPAGSSATVTNSGTATDPVFNFGIPRGEKGERGASGSGLPSGGAVGQMLYKASTEDYDLEWGDEPDGLPAGGTQGQVLTKNSSTDGDVSWQTPTAGGVGKDLTGQTVKPTSDTTVTAGTNAEIFNDYRTRTFYNDASVSAGNIASGDYSHAEGERTTASGRNSHSEGSKTIASGSSSHAEGYNTTASGVYAHAEGGNTTVSGNYSHAEGDTTIASGYGAHAEGAYTTASANYSHAEGSSTTAGYANQHVQGKYNNNKSTTLFEIGNGEPGDVSNAFEVYNDGSFSQDDGSTKFRFTNDGTNDGYYDASGTFHTFGSGGVGKDLTGQTVKPTSSSTVTAGTNAEIFNDYRDRTFSGTSITAGNVASGMYSHAEGSKTTASNGSSHAEGEGTNASGGSSHAEGSYTTASGQHSHAEGDYTKASGGCSHAEGSYTTASGDNSHVEGYYTTANRLNHSQGHFNKTMSAGAASSTTGDAMAIGNGTSQIALSNCFRVTYAGAVYGLSSYNSSGADYAEFFEWKDGNTESEDRVGYFVTTDGNKIKIANENDYILGIVSGHPSIVGNGDEDWLGRWMRDDFGRFLYDDVEIEDPETHEKTTSKTIRPNPEYDSTKEYVERKDRQEWDYVGMLGALAVRDDGTCEVNGFCKCTKGGIATKADAGYRVIQRISENVIKVIFR